MREAPPDRSRQDIVGGGEPALMRPFIPDAVSSTMLRLRNQGEQGIVFGNDALPAAAYPPDPPAKTAYFSAAHAVAIRAHASRNSSSDVA